MTITAHESPGSIAIADTSVDGVGANLFCIVDYKGSPTEIMRLAATVLTLASRLPGGWERAIELLRVELAMEQG